MKTINIEKFKIRCSGISDIMTNGRSSNTMGDTCKTFLKQWLIEQLTGIRKDVSSKELEKGIWCESEAIQLAGQHFNWFMAEKNIVRLSSSWLSGEADIVLPDMIVDIKCPWDTFTFPNFSKVIPVKGYGEQLQGYMELWNKPKAALVYVLMPTPEDIDIYHSCCQPEDGYESWELSERIRSYEIERDKLFMEAVVERVEQCRDFIKTDLIPELEEWKQIKIIQS